MTHDRYNSVIDSDPNAAFDDGPLGDLSIGIKSNIAVRGLPWTAGMGTRRDIIAERDAAVVATLRAAGAKVLGTLNMHEAALGAVTDNAFYGRTMNPHRDGYTPGGSSGGSGAAVAAGLCDVALGTDTLGSIRIPAAYCGVYGLKPTFGAVSTEGLVHLGRAFDVIGPLARDLDVLERVWVVLNARPAPLTTTLERVFILDDLAGVQVQPAVRAAYDRALTALGGASAALRFDDSLTAIRTAALADCGRELIAALGAARYGNGVSDELRAILAALEPMVPDPTLLARTRATLVEALGSDGVLVMPTTPHAAFAHGTRAPSSQAAFTGLANIAGLPALAIPAATDADGLPVGIQLVGPANSEHALIALARTLQPILGGAVPLPQGDRPCT